jgi:Zn finger protein HypA/HybF involved in hydrogenase expression
MEKPDDGFMNACPQCGQAQEIDEDHDLELLEIVAEV